MVATEDDPIGFSNALGKIFHDIQNQSYWLQKTVNVLASLPKGMQLKIKTSLHEKMGGRTGRSG
ncbi:MAG: hypothetical protein ACEY3J_01440 [Arsenophonus sp.]